MAGSFSVVMADDPGAMGWLHREVRRYPAAEARQGVAVDAEYFYAIDNRRIAQYRRDTGVLVRVWEGEKGGAVQHLNAGIVWDGLLYTAHSNYPANPERSAVLVFDTATMTLKSTVDLTDKYGGSLTWVARRGDRWYACFARYAEKGKAPDADAVQGRDVGRIVEFNLRWEKVGEWHFPTALGLRFGSYSASGGAFGPGGHLFVTGHDARELYVLRFPGEKPQELGHTLQWVATVLITAEGQAFAWDPTAEAGFFSISRKSKEVIYSLVDSSTEPPP